MSTYYIFQSTIIYNDYNSTYENLLIVSKLPTLKVRRLRTMAIEIYKILHQESLSYLHDFNQN